MSCYYKIGVIIFCSFCIITIFGENIWNPCVAQVSKNSEIDLEKPQMMTENEIQRADETAKRFINRFRETLDFGIVYDEMFATNAVSVLRKVDFFRSIGIEPKLVKKIDDTTLSRLYKAEMNLFYLRFVYDFSKMSPDLQINQHQIPPSEILTAIELSKFRPLLSNGWEGELPTIKTRQELLEYTSEIENIVKLYRKYLNSESFNSQSYKTGVKRLSEYLNIKPTVKNGWNEIGIGKKTKIYMYQSDIFVFPFIEENGELKILTLSMEV